MTERTAVHGVFTLERDYPHPPSRVFAAFGTAEGKAAWFSAPEDKWTLIARDFDFRVGGTERAAGRWNETGVVSDCHIRYFDIIPDERIVYAYEMYLDEVKISVSLATLEFRKAGAGTKFVLTEQGVFLDGYDDAGSREEGTNYLIDKMGASL